MPFLDYHSSSFPFLAFSSFRIISSSFHFRSVLFHVKLSEQNFFFQFFSFCSSCGFVQVIIASHQHSPSSPPPSFFPSSFFFFFVFIIFGRIIIKKKTPIYCDHVIATSFFTFPIFDGYCTSCFDEWSSPFEWPFEKRRVITLVRFLVRSSAHSDNLPQYLVRER